MSVADPGNPTVAGSLTFGTRTNDIAIGGNYAYVANEDSGLQVVDLAAPAAPARAANCALPQYSWAVALSGHFAYVAVLDSGLQIVDIADPLHPKRTGSWKPDTTAADYPGSYSIDAVAAAGTIVYLSFNNKFWIIDVSDSSLPVLKSSVAYMPYTRNVISLSGSTAYVPGNYGIAVIGVLHPDAPIIYPALIEPNSAMCAKISGSTLYVGYGSGGLRSYDISNPLSPTSLARFDTTMNYVRFDATQNGDTLYAINGNNNLSILQVASTAITSIGGYSSNWFSDVVVRDSIACMTRFDSGLVLLNVANPASVKRLGSARVGGWVSRVRLSRSRNLAFVVSRDSGLVVVDIRDPANPVRIGLYKSSMANAKITDVAFSGTRAYVAAGYYGKLEIISLADSTHPTFLGRLATCYASAVEMGGGDTVIAAAGYQGTMVINAADSANPVVIGSYKNADWRYGSAQSNTQAVATGPNHVMVECNGVAGVRLLRFGPEPAVAVVPAPSKLQARATGIAKNSQVRIYEINGRLVFHGSAAMMRPFLAGLKGVRLYIVEFSGPAGVVRDVKCMTGAAMGALLR